MATDKKGRKLPKGIRQRGNGYEGRFNYHYKEYVVHGLTITETQKAIVDLKYQLDHGTYIPKSDLTYGEWFDTWMEEYKKNRVKEGTLITYRDIYNSMIKDSLAPVKLTDIRPEHIQHLYNLLMDKGYSSSSLSTASAVIYGSLAQAYKNGTIEFNPADRVQAPRRKKETRKVHIAMTKEQQALFMECAKDSYLYNFFAVMLRTGMRSGELRALRYTDIDKRKNVIHVRHTLKYIKGKGYVDDTPKTASSLRDIPMTADVLSLLEAQHNYWYFKIEKIDQYLFCTEKGDPLSLPRIQLELKRIVKEINAGGNEFPEITTHVFRHTFATRAIEAGMQPQVLKTILGHSSLAITMDLYSHVLPDTKAAAMENIASAF